MTDRKTAIDYEKITIYPQDYDGETRQALLRALETLGIRFDYEQYA